ncbi:MAG TPA: hypothetical protein VGM76_11095 [Lacipirellulaceae bacterium]
MRCAIAAPITLAILLAAGGVVRATADEESLDRGKASGDSVSPAPGERPVAGDDLSIEQARLADRYERLETVLGRLAELSASSDPKRAKLLREAIAKSREQDVPHRFESIVSLLENERLAAAANRQTDLQNELDGLLTLLLKADRDKQVDSEHRRVKKYLQEVERLIRLEKDVKARTEGGDDTHRLSKDQQEVAGKTGKLGDAIGETEHQAAKAAKDAKDRDTDTTPTDEKPKDGGKSDGTSKSSPPSSSDSQKGPPAKSGQPSDLPPSPGESSPGKSSSGKPSPGNPSDSTENEPPQDQPSTEDQPTDRAAKQLKSAADRMQQAQKQLEKAQREDAAEEQKKAVQELEQAKAELERVLRQLREEEMEQTLTMLAARFKKMLESQIKVHEGTVRLDRIAEANRGHDDEIESARLSREESQIAHEAEKALLLLREEGSSVAFPETVSLMHEDMQQVATRLADFKVGTLTQGLEQDIIEALEETIAALQQAINNLDKKKSPPGQAQAGEPNDPPLVEKLAELKMIRSLQMRINRRTQRYGELIEGEQAEKPDLVEALTRLAERQQRVFQATSDLSQNRNE